VKLDVERSAEAAWQLLLAQVCFVAAIMLVKQSLQHFTPSGFMASRYGSEERLRSERLRSERLRSERLRQNQFI
jgi:hypothetical protein